MRGHRLTWTVLPLEPAVLWSLNAVSLPGRRSLRLDRVTAEVSRGVTVVLGQSGAGKTSLLNVLVGFERPASGRVEFQGTSNGGQLGVFWSPASHGLWPHLTVREHLRTVEPEPATSSDELLARFDLGSLAEVRPGSLSLGERSRLSVARAMAARARVLVIDEPLAHVDEARVGAYWKVIREWCTRHDMSLLMATHSPEVALREAGHVLCLDNGRLSYSGPVSELYDRPSSPELAAMLGPCNWLTADDARRWLDGGVSHSAHEQLSGFVVRPERLEVTVAKDAPLQVAAARFAGASGEVDLVDQRDGSSRTFVHRPAGPVLKAGDRVLLRLVMVLFAIFFVSGCDTSDGPTLAVKHEGYWSMPPDGPRVPAPRGMTVSPEDEYLVLDNAGRVLVFNKDGELQRTWWMPEYSVGKPEGIRVLKDGRIAVADTHYHRVVFFDREGKVTGMFGQYGKQPGDFVYPVALAQDDKENLYICEYGENDRVQKFRPDGTFVLQFGSFGTEDNQFQRPSGIAWFDSRLYVVDAFNNRIKVFDEAGTLLDILPTAEKTSDLYYPYDISVTDRGELFVIEYGAGRVSKFDRSGKLLGRYGHTGTEAGQFSTPWGLAVDRRGRVYVCDTGNRRIVELEL